MCSPTPPKHEEKTEKKRQKEYQKERGDQDKVAAGKNLLPKLLYKVFDHIFL